MALIHQGRAAVPCHPLPIFSICCKIERNTQPRSPCAAQAENEGNVFLPYKKIPRFPLCRVWNNVINSPLSFISPQNLPEARANATFVDVCLIQRWLLGPCQTESRQCSVSHPDFLRRKQMVHQGPVKGRGPDNGTLLLGPLHLEPWKGPAAPRPPCSLLFLSPKDIPGPQN